MVIALVIGIALNPLARQRPFQPGIVFCLKTILRWAVALLGLRIALGEIAALGLMTAILVVVAMVATLAAGFLLARLFALERAYGALAGAGTAVCGASATLATSIVLPDYKGKEMDVAFVVVAVNALSTVAMVVYPLFQMWRQRRHENNFQQESCRLRNGRSSISNKPRITTGTPKPKTDDRGTVASGAHQGSTNSDRLGKIIIPSSEARYSSSTAAASKTRS